MTEKKKRFHFRALVSVLTAFSFMVLALTGLVLFITPPGRVANWTGWQFAGLTKHQWGSQHIWFATLFLVASVLHIYLNWRPLLNYFKNRLTRKISLRMEWVVGVLICLAVFSGTLIELPPFASLIALNEGIKNSWDEQDQSAPSPHAELLSLGELATDTNLELDVLLGNLKSKGIQGTSPDVVVGDLAKANDMTPNELYVLATGNSSASPGGGAGHGGGRGKGVGGPGRKSLQELCANEGLDLQQVLQRLRDNDIDAEPDMILRDIAFSNGIMPPDLLDMIQQQ